MNNHLGSRDGVYSFVESTTNSHLSKLPDAKPNERFSVKAAGKKYDSEAFEQVNLLADSLNIPVTAIIQYSDDGQEFEYQTNYISIIKSAVMHSLIDQGLIDHDPLTVKRTETKRTYAAPQVIRQEGKAPRVIRDTLGAENISFTQQEIIESPDGWFLAEKIGDRIALGKKLLDTRQLQGLTIEGQNIEDYLHIELSVLLGAGINFEDSLRALIENNENIKFPGYISNRQLLIETYDDHNILVLPSFTEGQPYVVDESLARRRPVIIFEDIAEIIKGRKGIFVCKRNERSLRKTINYIFKNYAKIQKKIKKNYFYTKNNFKTELLKSIEK